MYVDPLIGAQYDSRQLAAFEQFVGAHYSDTTANPTTGSMSLEQFLDGGASAVRASAIVEGAPIALKSLLSLTVVRSMTEQAACKQNRGLPDHDPIFTWLWALMSWAELGPDRRQVLSRVARANAIPVIDIFGVSEGDFSTTTFDL